MYERPKFRIVCVYMYVAELINSKESFFVKAQVAAVCWEILCLCAVVRRAGQNGKTNIGTTLCSSDILDSELNDKGISSLSVKVTAGLGDLHLTSLENDRC